jgi:enoyl-[acyl-carrier protein] reductase II
MDKWKKAGLKVFPIVPSVAFARRMEKYGADGVIAEGTESGGHVGELTTMALVPQVVSAVQIPVVAAGGIASGPQMLAAFALGAVGVQIGTALLVSEECPIHINYKNAIIKAKDTDTTVTGRIAGIPVRILKNKMAREYLKREKEGANIEELELYTLGSLRKAVIDGDIHTGSLMSGQVAGQLKQIRPAGEIMEELFNDFRKAFEELKNSSLLNR